MEQERGVGSRRTRPSGSRPLLRRISGLAQDCFPRWDVSVQGEEQSGAERTLEAANETEVGERS